MTLSVHCQCLYSDQVRALGLTCRRLSLPVVLKCWSPLHGGAHIKYTFTQDSALLCNTPVFLLAWNLLRGWSTSLLDLPPSSGVTSMHHDAMFYTGSRDWTRSSLSSPLFCVFCVASNSQFSLLCLSSAGIGIIGVS